MNLSFCQTRCEEKLGQLLPPAGSRIGDAMRYTTLNGGKRLRAALAYACALDFSLSYTDTDHAACALECIHAYSLIHDDLPAMDNDDWRRGKPSNHKAFDQATAILAGDALNTLAFELLCQSPHSATVQISQIQILSRAAGWQGMVGGQMLDMLSTGKTIDFAALQSIHHSKTGALIQAALHLGCRPAADYLLHRHNLNTIGHMLGILYQIIDDILDDSTDSQTLGKTAGKDKIQGKNTYISHLGAEKSRQKIFEYQQEIFRQCENLPNKGEHLQTILQYITERHY